MRMMSAHMVHRILGGVLSLLTVGPAFAGSIAVNPVRVTLTATRTTGALVIRNSGADPSVVQLQIVSWSQQDGKDVYVPTRELLATPPIFTVPAGGSQTVRVGMRQGPDPRREGSYRLIMQEVPPPPKPEFRGLQVALRLSVPIFIAPAVESPPALAWRANLDSQGDLNVTAANTGNAHVQVLKFKLSSAGVELPPIVPTEAAYILPEQQRDWRLKLKSLPAAGSTLRVVAQTDAGDMEADVVVSGS